MEGLFFAVGSSRALLAPLGDFAMGMMNERYNANCPGNYYAFSPSLHQSNIEMAWSLTFLSIAFTTHSNFSECRDSYGHFCSHLVDTSEEGGDSALQCSSVQESCNIFLDSMQQACPTTCTECPSWEPTNPSTFWYILVVTSITSPFLGEYDVVPVDLSNFVASLLFQLFQLDTITTGSLDLSTFSTRSSHSKGPMVWSVLCEHQSIFGNMRCPRRPAQLPNVWANNWRWWIWLGPQLGSQILWHLFRPRTRYLM